MGVENDSATLEISKKRRLGFDKKQATFSSMSSSLMMTSTLRQKERFEAFVQFSTTIDEKLRKLHLNMTERVFRDILMYISEVESLMDAERVIEDSVRLLPVICFNTGINLADHKETFKILGKYLEKELGEKNLKVCRLPASKVTTLKSTFASMCNQLGVKFSVDATITNIEKHFRQEQLQQDDEEMQTTQEPLIVIILENCEAIDIRIFSKFLEIIANAQSNLKIMVILGIATDTEMLKDLIPYEALSLCDIKQFRCLAATHYLQEFLDAEVMHPDSYFQLSGRCFEWSLIEFLSHDFSVANYASKLKFAALAHYSNYFASFACWPREKSLEVAKTISKREIAIVNSLPSVKQSQISSTAEFVAAIKEFFDNEQKTRMLLKCLLSVQSHLIEPVFGTRTRQIYMRSLSEAIYKSSEYRKFITYYGVLDVKSFQKSVEELWKLLGSAPQKDSFPMLSQTVCDTFNRLQTEDLNKLLEDPDLKEPEIKRPKRAAKNAFELQKQLKEMAIQNKPGPKTVFQEIRKEFCGKLDKIVEKYLSKARQEKPFAEIFFFYKLKLVDNKMVPPMVNHIERSLKNPYQYTKEEKMQLANADSSNANLPPVCVAFKLFTQMGSMVNVADWLDSFKCILETRSEKIKKEDLDATFFQSVSDLQFLGLLKPTQRKTDHVQKVTWAL